MGLVLPLFVDNPNNNAKTATCSECGLLFVPKNSHHKTCCIECSIIRKNRKLKENRKKREEQLVLARQKVAKNKKVEEREDVWDIIAFYEDGNSLSQTALKFKSSELTIKRVLSDHEIKIRGSEFYNREKNKTTSEIKKLAIQEYISTNITTKGLAKKYNLSKRQTTQLTLGVKKMVGTKGGYKTTLKPGHHRANSEGKVLEHVVIAEAKLNRPVSKDEQIHHVDFNKQNNHPANLAVGEPKQHGFWHKTHAEVMTILMPIMFELGIITFCELEGYDIDPVETGKLKRLLKQKNIRR